MNTKYETLAEQPAQQEPVAIEYWLQDTMESGRWVTAGDHNEYQLVPLYTSPQPAQQEPVGWFESPNGEFRANPSHKTVFPSSLLSWKIPLYTSPQASKPWVGLTDEEMHACWGDPLTPLGMKHARLIEAKLKEKNE